MEEQEGYTALQFKGRRKPEDKEEYTALQFKERRKPDNEEEHTALQFQGRTEPEDRQEDLRADPQGPHFQRPPLWIIVLLTVLTVLLVLAVTGSGIWTDPQGPRFQRSALWIIVSLTVLTVLLVLAVTGSGIWIFKLHQENRDLKTSLKQRDDPEAQPSPSCPPHWELRGRKCYYFPGVSDQNWSESHEDCSSRGSRLVVIEDKAELDYFTSKLVNQAWIGLFITPVGGRWTWVNGSTLNENVFRVAGPAGGDRCGAVSTDSSIQSSHCINSFYWICQKEAEISSSGV